MNTNIIRTLNLISIFDKTEYKFIQDADIKASIINYDNNMKEK